MADFPYNISKGRIHSDFLLPLTNDAVLGRLYKAVEGVNQRDRDTFADLTGNGNTKSDATNYADQTLGGIVVTVDDANDRVDIDTNDATYTNLGGALNNNIVAFSTGYDDDTTSGTDSNIRPMTNHDVSFTTDGSTVVLTINTLFRAA